MMRFFFLCVMPPQLFCEVIFMMPMMMPLLSCEKASAFLYGCCCCCFQWGAWCRFLCAEAPLFCWFIFHHAFFRISFFARRHDAPRLFFFTIFTPSPAAAAAPRCRSALRSFAAAPLLPLMPSRYAIIRYYCHATPCRKKSFPPIPTTNANGNTVCKHHLYPPPPHNNANANV